MAGREALLCVWGGAGGCVLGCLFWPERGDPQESWVGVRQKLRKALITLRIGRALRSKASALKLSGSCHYCFPHLIRGYD